MNIKHKPLYYLLDGKFKRVSFAGMINDPANNFAKNLIDEVLTEAEGYEILDIIKHNYKVDDDCAIFINNTNNGGAEVIVLENKPIFCKQEWTYLAETSQIDIKEFEALTAL